MKEPTKRQKQVLEFISKHQQTYGVTPTLREIAKFFKFRSMTSAVDHIRLLRNKGLVDTQPLRARSIHILSPYQALKKRVIDIPVFGTIPAGWPQTEEQKAESCVSVDVGTVGIKPSARTFALEVHGESMIGKHIVDGDIAILEHGVTPSDGDVVAALIDNESTLKTYVMEKNKPYLKSENPNYPNLIPAQELVIQGVMVALIRRAKK
jgi:repressor LexA